MQQMYEDRFSSLDAALEGGKQKLVNDEQKSGYYYEQTQGGYHEKSHSLYDHDL